MEEEKQQQEEKIRLAK